jgi:hypothetical protein
VDVLPLKLWFSGITRGCAGLWEFLTARVQARKAVELERERNSGTATALQLLPPGAELLEYERDGRLRVIRMPDRPAVPPEEIRDTPPEPPRELPDGS